jgi:hypothetical protein
VRTINRCQGQHGNRGKSLCPVPQVWKKPFMSTYAKGINKLIGQRPSSKLNGTSPNIPTYLHHLNQIDTTPHYSSDNVCARSRPLKSVALAVL